MTAPLSLVPLALLWLGCASAQGVLDELFQVEVDLLLPPQSLLEGLSLRHKLEKVQVKINLAYWDSLRPRVAAFNRGKWPMLGVRVSEELANCSEMDFNFGSE